MSSRHPTEHTPADCGGGNSFRPIRGALYLLWCAVRVSVWILYTRMRARTAEFSSSLFVAWAVAGASLGIAATVITLALWWDAIRKVVAG